MDSLILFVASDYCVPSVCSRAEVMLWAQDSVIIPSTVTDPRRIAVLSTLLLARLWLGRMRFKAFLMQQGSALCWSVS